ncbi:unnamed protein product [Echinostoma caproni]|uniref:t-SNARE coiled-coil homology domain-containing protein n=1 Tax=Echinostoma caproni TaxID=27848 RepID=A0A183AGU5_9TREM|nr:unnamed protein product [Echinostoma caproni]
MCSQRRAWLMVGQTATDSVLLLHYIKRLTLFSEQLRRVDQNMDVIHEDMMVAEGQLEELEKCCGLCVLPWKKLPLSLALAGDYTPVSFILCCFILRTRITNDAREDEMEENLQQVAHMVGDLRVMAGDMGQEIRTHNEVLDRIDRKVNRCFSFWFTIQQYQYKNTHKSACRILLGINRHSTRSFSSK